MIWDLTFSHAYMHVYCICNIVLLVHVYCTIVHAICNGASLRRIRSRRRSLDLEEQWGDHKVFVNHQDDMSPVASMSDIVLHAKYQP